MRLDRLDEFHPNVRGIAYDGVKAAPLENMRKSGAPVERAGSECFILD